MRRTAPAAGGVRGGVFPPRASRAAGRGLLAASPLLLGAIALLVAASPARARPDENLEKIAEALADLCTSEPKDRAGDRTKIAEAAKALGGGPQAEAAQALVEAIDADLTGDGRAAAHAGERVEAVAAHVDGKIMKRAVALTTLIGARWERTREVRERRAEAALVAFGVSAEADGIERWLELARAGEAARLLGQAAEAAASWKDAAPAAPPLRRREIEAVLGRSLDRLGRVVEAAQAFEAALAAALPPAGAPRTIGRGGSGPDSAAVVEPLDDASLRSARALALERAGDLEGALAALGAAAAGEAVDPLGQRARIEAALGKRPPDAAALEACAARTALHSFARAGLAEAALAKGETQTALAHARVAFAFDPRNPARVGLMPRAAESAGDKSDPGGEWAQAARWKLGLDAALEAARAQGLEHPTATALRAAARDLEAGEPKAALTRIGEPAEWDGEAHLLKLRALEAVGPANRNKVAKAATALMKRFGDAPELRALGGTPPPGSPTAAGGKPGTGPAATGGAKSSPGAADQAYVRDDLAGRSDGTGMAVTFGILGATILIGGAAMFVLRKKPSASSASAPASDDTTATAKPAGGHSVPATRRYEKPKAGAKPAGAAPMGPKEIAIGAVAVIVLAVAGYKIYDAFALPPAVDPSVRVRLSGDPVPLYRRRAEDETIATIPPGSKVLLGHEFGRPPEGGSARVTVTFRKADEESPLFGYVDERDIVAEDLASLRKRRAEAVRR